MSKICNFPISQIKRCKQPMADDRPNCGRHKTNLPVDHIGQDPITYRKNGELHVWAGEPDGLYCLIHRDPAYQTLCQLAGEKVPYCLNRTVKWTDGRGKLHRDDGPALIRLDGTQEWWQNDKQHREDGPAIIRPNGVEEWFQRGDLHRDDGPAVTWPDGAEEWYQHGKLHRDDGPAEIYANGSQFWYQCGERHREDGPAEVRPDGTQKWYWHGQEVTEEEHAELREQSGGV